jgi:hypothetical protein
MRGSHCLKSQSLLPLPLSFPLTSQRHSDGETRWRFRLVGVVEVVHGTAPSPRRQPRSTPDCSCRSPCRSCPRLNVVAVVVVAAAAQMRSTLQAASVSPTRCRYLHLCQDGHGPLLHVLAGLVAGLDRRCSRRPNAVHTANSMT